VARYSITFVDDARAEIRNLKVADRGLVLDAIKTHLVDRPSIQEGDKKVLRGLKPPWIQVRPVWQLTVVPFRVFYDVDEDAREVVINAVRRKPSRKTTKEIL